MKKITAGYGDIETWPSEAKTAMSEESRLIDESKPIPMYSLNGDYLCDRQPWETPREALERALLGMQEVTEDRIEALARRVGRLEGMIAGLTGVKPWEDDEQ